ncbi:MAG TPA: hypothetical protein VFQ22_02345 [Longimicrobiales bacterium]|nr:hypothetical protein [Longimicrobiales bacterium]
MQPQVGAAAEGTAGGFCRVERWPIAPTGTTQLYIEPQSLFQVGSRWVVAGVPSMRWELDFIPTPTMRTRGEYVGATLGPGASIPFENPIDGHLQVVRGVALEGERWGALLAEYESEDFPDTGRLLAVHYLEHDGRAWSAAQTLPLPDEGELRPLESSTLVRVGDRLLWAVPLGLDSDESPLVLYERVDGRWSRRIVVGSFVEGVDLGWDGETPWLVVAGPDLAAPVWERTIRLYRELEGEWGLVRRVWTAPDETLVYELRLTALASGATVTWRAVGPASQEAMAWVGVRGDQAGTLVVLDEYALQAAPLAMLDGTPAWLVHRVSPITGQHELRLVKEERGSPVRVAGLPNPFVAFYIARTTPSGQILAVGPEYDPDPARPTVRSLTLRLSIACD